MYEFILLGIKSLYLKTGILKMVLFAAMLVGYITWVTVFRGSYTISVITYLYLHIVYKEFFTAFQDLHCKLARSGLSSFLCMHAHTHTQIYMHRSVSRAVGRN